MIEEEHSREDIVRGGNTKPTPWHRVRLYDHMARVVSVGWGPTRAAAKRDAWECLPATRRKAVK